MSNQMEFKYLAHLTGRKEYYRATERVMEVMHGAAVPNGLYASNWNRTSGAPTNAHFPIGAFADSAYEYLLKQWLLTSRSEPLALQMYLKSAKGIIEHLLHLTPNRHLLYATDAHHAAYQPSHAFEHLSCFLPGLLALGVQTLPEAVLPAAERERHLWAAEGLAETCWATYADSATGLGPDEMLMEPWPKAGAGPVNTSRWVEHVAQWERDGRPTARPPGAGPILPESDQARRDWTIQKDGYLLRPETIESFYVLWRTTGDVRWRERGWAIFQAIEKHCKTKYGYASLLNVDSGKPRWKDDMPSFFLAETLKYFYLLFKEEDILPHDKWVFNTEAHPLPIFEWSKWEKDSWPISTGR